MAEVSSADPPNKGIVDALGVLENDLEAPAGSLVSLMTKDDWSLVISGQALIEGAVSLLLSTKLDPRLRDTFGKLPLVS